MEITKKENCSFDLNVKRFYAPFVIKDLCPNCKEPYINDLTQDYISYPILGKPTVFNMYCHKCENEWSGEITIEIEIEAVIK